MTEPAARFRDPLVRKEAFLDIVLVMCPRCRARATVAPEPGSPSPVPLHRPRRLVCERCTFVAATPGGHTSLQLRTGRDPFFGADLLLQMPCRYGLVWAYNVEHLDLLESFVSATIRERGEISGSMSLIERLPAWMKSRKNRDEIIQTIRRLRTLIA